MELLWADGTQSWIARSALKGEPAQDEWDNQEPEEPEVICSQKELEEKVKILVKWIQQRAKKKKKRFIVFHVGAGMSAGDGVPTFRGVGGLWTRGREDISNFDLAAVQPGYPYEAMIALEQNGFVDWVVTQNYDNLFRKSGFPTEKLSEIHGNIFIEKCPSCGKTFARNFPVEKEDGEDHRTGRLCEDKWCHSELVDNLVHFGDALNDGDQASEMSEQATLSIAIGTKLMVTPAADWVFYPHLKKKGLGKVIIVNSQITPADDSADLVIHHKADAFFRTLCKALKIDV